MPFRIRLIVPILLIFAAVILRFYNLQEFATFLGDQGRDAIVLKRIITLEHFPAIGAPSSLGQIYLGPFYYYLIAPFLLLFNFNPIGPVFGVAFLSILGIVLAAYIIKKETNYKIALFFFIFEALSAVNIQASRFSWNPNLLPIFSFLTIYFFYKVLTTKYKVYAILFGSFFSLSIQLHHLAFLLTFPFVLVYIANIVLSSRTRFGISLKQMLKLVQHDIGKLLISFLSFLFFSIPLLIFDLRHEFLNTKNFIKLLTEGNPTDHEGLLGKFLETNQSFYQHVFQFNLNQYFALIVSIIFFVILIKRSWSKKRLFLQINLFTLILYLFSFSFLNTTHNAHYYASIYLSFFFVLSWLLTTITKNKYVLIFISALIFIGYVFFNIKSINYLFLKTGENQIKKAEIVAESIIRENPQIPFQSIALPNAETDGHIRYFLEIKGKRPLPADTLVEPVELYALCFDKECKVLGNPEWQIAAFKKAIIDKIWNTEGVIIYKVTHGK